jgi:surface polysaccharide O-acyltransferase-like enzyme
MTTRVSCKKQVPELRILQSLAFLAVVLQSALIYTMNQPNLAPEQAVMIGMFFNFAKFSAPTFIFIVGFTLLYHHEKQVRYQHYILEKVSELIIPYVLWSLIYLIMAHQIPFLSGSTVSEALKAILTGSAAPHLWYVVMMFQIHLLFPILFVLFHWFRKRIHSKSELYKVIAVFALAYFTLMWFSSHYIFNGESLTNSAVLRYTDRTFLFYSFYFVLGGIAALTLPTWRKFIIKNVPLNTFIFLILFVIVGYELLSFDGVQAIHLQVSTYLKPSMFLYIISEIMLLYALAMTIVQSRSIVYKVLQFIGRFTYGAYLAHFFFLHISANLLSMFDIPRNSLIYGLVLFAVTVMLSILTIVMMSFMPFGNFITGPVVKLSMKLLALPSFSFVQKVKHK